MAGLQAWNLWAAQGGMKADAKRGRPLSRIAVRAKEIAEHKALLGELFGKLDRLFPLGYSNRWDRSDRSDRVDGGKGVAA